MGRRLGRRWRDAAGGGPVAGGASVGVPVGCGVAGPGLEGRRRRIAGGSLVTVMDSRGIPLGTALYSDASQIALRMVSREAGLERAEYLEQVRERLGRRWRCGGVAPESMENDACRLIFSEADGCRGLWRTGITTWWCCSC
jgi:23S rRNA G2069 N7-methylase RlmK/C1962 C5-methylase RlmI